MNYKVFESTSSYGLTNVIESMLKDGWTPQGGVCVTQMFNNSIYAQAMVKNEEKRGRPRKEV